MIELTLGHIVEITEGQLNGAASPEAMVTGEVVIDSRRAGSGGLFVALPGEHVDGHDYASAAVAAGAVAVLGSRDIVGVPMIIVPDAELALGKLAHAVLALLPTVTVIAITGSVGKTTTKDLLAAVLETQAATVAPVESFNNEIGLPLTVLKANEHTRYLVLEMGASGLGHLRYLTEIAQPDVALVLRVGVAHLGEFGGIEATSRAKAELIEALPADGVAVLNADDQRVLAMREKAPGRVVLFAETDPEGVEVFAHDVAMDDLGRASFTARVNGGEARVSLQLVGAHQISNALAVLAAGHVLGLPLAAMVDALSHATPRSRYRMEVTERPDGVTIVNDAYNANPDSMRAALKALAAMSRGRRSFAVLGEMLELGDGTIAEHDAVGRLVVRLNISHTLAVGGGAKAIHSGALQEGSWGREADFVADIDAAYDFLHQTLEPGDVVLVKSSHGAGLHTLGERLANDLGESATTDASSGCP